MEAFAVSYVWGVDRFLEEAKAMVGPDVVAYYPRTWSYYRFCWAYASPVLLLTLFITTFVLYFTEYSSYSSYVCHDAESKDCPNAQWGVGFGMTLGLVALAFIPGAAAMKFYYDRYLNFDDD